MPSIAMTVPYMHTSPLNVPRRDLVLGSADSLFLRVTIVDSDNPCAQALELTGGIGGPALMMTVWPDARYRTSWDYGAYPYIYPPQVPLWTGLGTISDAIGAFDISFPAATMTAWPRRCGWALQLDWDGGNSSELIAEGRLHLRPSIARSVDQEVLLTDTLVPIVTDQAGQAILVNGR